MYRRDVFFTLVDKLKHRNPRSAIAPALAGAVGTIECRVYRAEKTGEWNGTISPEELPAPSHGKKGVSHTVRLGASIPAAKTVRYTFKNLDPEDAPFAFFRFYYRSKKFLQRSPLGSWSLTRPSSPIQIPRPLSRTLTQKSSLYKSLTRGKDFLADKFSRHDSVDLRRVTSPGLEKSDPNLGVGNLEADIQRLETDLALVATTPEDAARIQALCTKLEQLKESPGANQQIKESPSLKLVESEKAAGKRPEFLTLGSEKRPTREDSVVSEEKSVDILGDSHVETKAKESPH